MTDSGNAPMRIETEATKVLVHGKNIVNPNAFTVSNNTSFEALENGYVDIGDLDIFDIDYIKKKK